MESELIPKKLNNVQSILIWPFPIGGTDLTPMARRSPMLVLGMVETIKSFHSTPSDIKSPRSTEKKKTHARLIPRAINCKKINDQLFITPKLSTYCNI